MKANQETTTLIATQSGLCGSERPANDRVQEDAQMDTWREPVQFRVPAAELRRLSTINQTRSIVHIAGEWAAIILSIALCSHFWNPFLYVLTVAWIGARQHALLILMHEGTHFRLFTKKWVNDLISESLLAWPMFITARAYRIDHFAHHRNINTSDDPDWMRKQNHEWEFPKSWKELAVILFRDLCALNAHQLVAEVTDLSGGNQVQARPTTPYRIARATFYAVALGLLFWNQAFVGFLLFWVVPFATWFKVIIRIRGIAEHYGIDDTTYGLSRTTLLSWFDRWFVAPNNINYHLEHHLYPSVPFYRLPELHTLLMTIPGFRDKAHVTHTYWGVLRECVNRSKAAPCGIET
jgi:fatty acid desaturase